MRIQDLAICYWRASQAMRHGSPWQRQAGAATLAHMAASHRLPAAIVMRANRNLAEAADVGLLPPDALNWPLAEGGQ